MALLCLIYYWRATKMLLPYGRENAKFLQLLRNFAKILISFLEHPFFSRSLRNPFRSTNFLHKLHALHSPALYKILRENLREGSNIFCSPFSFCKAQLYTTYSRIRVFIVLFSPETEVRYNYRVQDG